MSAGYHEEISDYSTQASHFLARGREYLASGDLHQASEKDGALHPTWPRR